MILIDAQAMGHIAEAIGKGIGLAWLVGHHGKAVWKTLGEKKGRTRCLENDADTQIAQKAQEDQDGRLIREAIFSQLEQSQQIENLNAVIKLREAVISLRESEVAMQKGLSSQYQQAANEWQQDAESWRTQAHQAQDEIKQRDSDAKAVKTKVVSPK